MKDLLKKYNELNDKKKEFDKERKKVGKVIQQKLDDDNLDELEVDDYKVNKIQGSSGKKINEDRLLEILKENNIDAIKETPDIDKIEEMIDNNELENDVLVEIADCISENTYTYIRVKQRK